MINSRIKKIAILLILLHGFLISVHYTDADIFAERTVKKNKIVAISLDLKTISSIDHESMLSLFNSHGILPGGYDLKTVRIKGEANKEFKFHLKTIKTNGDDFFCEKIKLDVFDKNFSKKYSGSVMDLSINYVAQEDLSNLIFFINFDDEGEEFKNKICEFNFNFRSYHDDINENKGIIAVRELRNIITSGDW